MTPPTRRPAGRRRAGAAGPGTARAATAPGRQRRTAGPGPTRATAGAQARWSRRAPAGLTGRAVLLGLVVCALVLSLAYPVKEYLGQRADIAALEQTQRDTQARVDALESLRRQLQDPAYITAQARERLRYVMPGDRIYIPVQQQGRSEVKTEQVAPAGTSRSWVERLGESFRRADSG
ncbi:MAG: FtsB family cell division protein [Geodermatophilaceae bacterium]